MIDAIYFDGQTTRRHPVTMIIHQRVVSIRGAGVQRSVRMSQLNISERLEHAPRILRFADGAFLEARDRNLDQMLKANRFAEPRVVRWQNNWPLSLVALVSLVALLAAGYQWGLPWAGDRVAQHLPASLEHSIGEHQMMMMEGTMMQPSRLPQAEQQRLREMFAGLQQPRGEKTPYRLEFRDSNIGPNAFAMPNGVIVMTDQLVRVAGNDHAVLAVLGHELGHLQHHHSMRGLVRAIGLGAVLQMWVGDVSSVLAAVPTMLLNQSYSRDFERDADLYAIDMMHVNALPLSPMADLFEKMHARNEQADGDDDSDGKDAADDENWDDDGADDNAEPGQAGGGNWPGDKAPKDAPPDFFSSHPSDAERIALLRAADKK
jgi:Zn-dependent protease with chaperone function